MGYEQAIRDKAAELMNESTLPTGGRYDLAAALKAARGCADTRTWEFTEKIQLEPTGGQRSADNVRSEKPRDKKRKKVGSH